MTQSPNQKPQQSKPANTENPWLETIKTLGLSVILAFGIRTFVAEARYIPSGSMLPTLEINDRLIIEKLSKHFRKPERGDIIVFWPPSEATSKCLGQHTPTPKRRDAYIKRVIGLPGEEVRVTNQQVYINGRKLDEEYTLKDSPSRNFSPVTVPDNAYLVLGDNRNNSCDSRSWGFVVHEDIIGRAVLRFWPMGRLGSLYEETVYSTQEAN